jgi:CRISPR-associated protein Csm5
MRLVAAGDSAAIAAAQLKVYLLRASTLLPRGAGYTLGWKQSPRGSVDGNRPEDGTAFFAEMAVPGSTFQGRWDERVFFLQPEIRRALRWPEAFGRAKIFEAANIYAAGLLALQRQYAAWAGLSLLDQSLAELEGRLAAAAEKGACLISIGWGGGLPAKSSWLDTTNPEYRQILGAYNLYNRALSSKLPFPKTRRIVFLNNRPATLPGWAELAVD